MSYDKQECMSALEESDEVFYAKMQKGLDDARNGRITPLDDVYAELTKAISELKNEAPVADAEEFIKGLMNSQRLKSFSYVFGIRFYEILKKYCVCVDKNVY